MDSPISRFVEWITYKAAGRMASRSGGVWTASVGLRRRRRSQGSRRSRGSPRSKSNHVGAELRSFTHEHSCLSFNKHSHSRAVGTLLYSHTNCGSRCNSEGDDGCVHLLLGACNVTILRRFDQFGEMVRFTLTHDLHLPIKSLNPATMRRSIPNTFNPGTKRNTSAKGMVISKH